MYHVAVNQSVYILFVKVRLAVNDDSLIQACPPTGGFPKWAIIKKQKYRENIFCAV